MGLPPPRGNPNLCAEAGNQPSASSSRSIAINSSLVPCTLGPVNHFRALSCQYSHIPTKPKMISGPVKLKLFCLKKEFPGLANSLISLPLPQIGQNGQNTGGCNGRNLCARIVTQARCKFFHFSQGIGGRSIDIFQHGVAVCNGFTVC